MTLGDLIAAAAVVLTGTGLIVALKGVRDQLRMSTFLTYTERYASVMARMPFEARRPASAYDLESVESAEREAVLSSFRDYFNMCSEELWLASSGRIDKATWKLWRMGMREVVSFPSFASAWNSLRQEYVVYSEFRSFMDALAADAATGKSRRIDDVSSSDTGHASNAPQQRPGELKRLTYSRTDGPPVGTFGGHQ